MSAWWQVSFSNELAVTFTKSGDKWGRNTARFLGSKELERIALYIIGDTVSTEKRGEIKPGANSQSLNH